MKRVMCMIASILMVSCVGGKGDEGSKGPGWTDLGNAEFQKGFESSKDVLLLDVRTPEEYASGHIPGAVLIPVQELEVRLDEIAAWKDKPVYVYCRSGSRSRKATAILAANGFGKIFNLDRGILGWAGENYPLE